MTNYDPEAEDLAWERRQRCREEVPRRRHVDYRCGGYASHTGHCGALDCSRCHPGGMREECDVCGAELIDDECPECEA